MTRSELGQLYNKFWLNYTNALPKSISYYPYVGSAFNVKQISDTEFLVKLEVDFNRLRYKSSSKRSNLALQVRGIKRCVFTDNKKSLITCSNVNIYYFKNVIVNEKTKLSLIDSLHYDYEIDLASLRNHPLFHCQSGEYTKQPFFGRNDFDFENIKQTSHHQVRIPTANMDMISVLLSITADHLALDDFEKVLNVYDDGNWHNVFPHISHHERFSPGNCFRSRAWYIG